MCIRDSTNSTVANSRTYTLNSTTVDEASFANTVAAEIRDTTDDSGAAAYYAAVADGTKVYITSPVGTLTVDAVPPGESTATTNITDTLTTLGVDTNNGWNTDDLETLTLTGTAASLGHSVIANGDNAVSLAAKFHGKTVTDSDYIANTPSLSLIHI